MAERPSSVLDYGAFQQPPSRLFRDYLAGAGSVGRFYEGGRWDLDAVIAAGERSAASKHPRQDVAKALVEQQRVRGADRAAERAALLADPRAVAIVSGQQAVLFGGPLYVLYKALAAVKLARLVEAKRGAPAVAVFWVASDDHDFAEIRSVSVVDEAGRLRALRYAPRDEPVGQPASGIALDDTLGALLQETAECLPPSLHREATLELLRRCYRPGLSIADAFARLLSALLPELVVMDPADPQLKRLMVPVMCREIAEASPTSRLAETVGPELLRAGYHQQVPVRDGFFNLFWVYEHQRRALAHQEGLVEIRGTGRRVNPEETQRQLEERPELWSPGVLLRPLAQDLLLPTAAYVGGPAEIAYHAQIGPSYGRFAIPRPALVPRPSLTLVEAAQARALEAEGLTPADLEGDPEAQVARWAREAYPDVEAAFARANQALDNGLSALEEALGRVDPTLKAAADAARGRARHQIDGLHEKATRALKKRDQARADRLRRTRDALFPGGSFQERGLGFVGVLARHGLGIVSLVDERMDVFAKGHQVVYL